MITVAALIALGYFKVEYSAWLFAVTVIQDLALIDFMMKVAK
ncbi:MAG: hypothetical protein ACRC91_19050 [Aeromonas sp.]